MATIKLQIDDFEETDYDIIALNTSLEDYRLAYFINQKLFINLSKSKNDVFIQIKNDESYFTHFIFEDEENDICWSLVQNKSQIAISQNSISNDLFSESYNNIESTIYLLPEYKKVDFLLKIDNSCNDEYINEIISKLNEIDKITLVYRLDKDKIKTKNNLIF